MSTFKLMIVKTFLKRKKRLFGHMKMLKNHQNT